MLKDHPMRRALQPVRPCCFPKGTHQPSRSWGRSTELDHLSELDQIAHGMFLRV
jgi:hypothetical protein